MPRDQKQPSGVALVTGAGSGMGAAAARLMSEAGWPLLLCDINGDALKKVADNLHGPQIELLIGDIAEVNFPQNLVHALASRPVGAVIHCAAVGPSSATAARILDVDLIATMRLVDTVRPLMAEGSAAVLFSSSGAHIMGPIFDEQIAKVKTPEAVATLSAIATDGYLAYGIAKRAIQVLAQRESFAFAQRGARIVSISPGIIDTPMGRREMEANPIMQTMIKSSAIGRAGRAEEVAAVAVFLCSPAASFVTGVDIHVEGGSFAAERPIGQWKSGE